jgi:hypothetical protein
MLSADAWRLWQLAKEQDAKERGAGSADGSHVTQLVSPTAAASEDDAAGRQAVEARILEELRRSAAAAHGASSAGAGLPQTAVRGTGAPEGRRARPGAMMPASAGRAPPEIEQPESKRRLVDSRQGSMSQLPVPVPAASAQAPSSTSTSGATSGIKKF